MARASRIGFLVDGLLSRYQVRLFDAIRRAAQRRGAIVIGFPGSYLGGQDSDRATFDGSFVYELAGPTSVDGIIVASNLILSGVGATRVQALFEQKRVPLVSVGPMPGVTTVDVDNRTGLKQVVQHLVRDHGRRRLAFIRGPITNPDSLDRERVFRSTLEELGIEACTDMFVTGDFLESSGAAAVRTLFGERRYSIDDLDGIVAANDQMATGAMQELRARGLRIPEDLAVVGFDDDDHARSAHPPLTTVAQPMERLGETAVELLIEKIAGRATCEQTILETLPVLRRSCGCRDGLSVGPQLPSDSDDLCSQLSRLRDSSIRRLEWLGADDHASGGVDRAQEYLTTASDENAHEQLVQLERIVLELALRGIDPLHWQDILSPMIEEVFRHAESPSGVHQKSVIRGQQLYYLFSQLSGVVLLREQLRTIELANSLRVIGSAVVCARNFRALGRVLDAGLPGLDVHYCCVCVFTNEERSRARVATLYNPTVRRPHNQIHSAEQLWRAVPPTVPPGVTPSSMGTQSFRAMAIIPPNTSTPPNGDFLVFPLMFGDEALGYVALDAPADAQRAWLLEGLSGHLSSAIYEISRTEQLRVAREVAEEANSAKSAFVAMMSHEVRTPLNAIMGNLDLCLRTELSREQRKQLVRAQTSSRALRGIVDDILDYSRVEARRIELESVPFDLEEVLEQIVSTCAPEASRKHLELVIDVDCDVARRLTGDPLRLTQVLLNLVNNAVKFSTRGFVALRVHRTSDDGDPLHLRFIVEDSGIGMGPDQISRIFQPFTQADNTITRRYGGTGLGLTICQRLVELMGGEVLVESEIGLGSKFEFTVPLRADGGDTEIPGPLTLTPATVVLAVSSPAQLEALERLMSGLGHEVMAFGKGTDALHAVENLSAKGSSRRNFVFVDHRLSDMTCKEFSSKVRHCNESCGLSLIVLVPHDNDMLLAGDWQVGTGESMLAKPPLRSSIERILNGAHSSRPGADSAAPERQSPRSALVGRRILVVQDSEMSRELACELLTLNGAETRTAGDGEEAIALARTEHFDLILMDLNLPVLDGYMAAKAIREQYGADTLPIVALSASGTHEDRARCIGVGMNDFLRAPVGEAELVDTVQSWLINGEGLLARASSSPPNSATLRMNVATGPVLDIARAIGRLGGNRNLYMQLLKRFSQSHASGLEELSNAFESNDFPRAANLAHVLVSAAGNIGATRLQYAAQSLEIASRQAHLGRILAVRPRFEAEWQASVLAAHDALERHLEDSHPPAAAILQPLTQDHVEHLRRLIHEHDTAAVELVDFLREGCVTEPQIQQVLQQLAFSVSAYDFEAAQLHLDSLCTSLAIRIPPLPQRVS